MQRAEIFKTIEPMETSLPSLELKKTWLLDSTGQGKLALATLWALASDLLQPMHLHKWGNSLKESQDLCTGTYQVRGRFRSFFAMSLSSGQAAEGLAWAPSSLSQHPEVHTPAPTSQPLTWKGR
jgi:hypothetical protein